MLKRYWNHLEDNHNEFAMLVIMFDAILSSLVFVFLWVGYWVGDVSLYGVFKYTIAIPSPLHVAVAIPFAVWLANECRR